jgi:hypothetical protein
MLYRRRGFGVGRPNEKGMVLVSWVPLQHYPLLHYSFGGATTQFSTGRDRWRSRACTLVL